MHQNLSVDAEDVKQADIVFENGATLFVGQYIASDEPARILEITRHAIRSWRRLAGLSVVNNVPLSAAGAGRRKGTAA